MIDGQVTTWQVRLFVVGQCSTRLSTSPAHVDISLSIVDQLRRRWMTTSCIASFRRLVRHAMRARGSSRKVTGVEYWLIAFSQSAKYFNELVKKVCCALTNANMQHLMVSQISDLC